MSVLQFACVSVVCVCMHVCLVWCVCMVCRGRVCRHLSVPAGIACVSCWCVCMCVCLSAVSALCPVVACRCMVSCVRVMHGVCCLHVDDVVCVCVCMRCLCLHVYALWSVSACVSVCACMHVYLCGVLVSVSASACVSCVLLLSFSGGYNRLMKRIRVCTDESICSVFFWCFRTLQ